MKNKLIRINKVMVIVLSTIGVTIGGVGGTKIGLDYKEQRKEEKAIALDKQMAKIKEEAGTKVKFEIPKEEKERMAKAKKEKEEKLKKEEEAKKQAEIKAQKEEQAKKEEEERLEQERQQQQQEEQARLEEQQAQQVVEQEQYVEPVQQEVAQTQQAVQPVTNTNTGTSINGFQTTTQRTQMVEGFGTENILYEYDYMPSLFLAERIAPTGNAVRGLYVGANVTINGRVYTVYEIRYGKANNDATMDEMAYEIEENGAIAIQTCETSNADSTLTVVFAK